MLGVKHSDKYKEDPKVIKIFQNRTMAVKETVSSALQAPWFRKTQNERLRHKDRRGYRNQQKSSALRSSSTLRASISLILILLLNSTKQNSFTVNKRVNSVAYNRKNHAYVISNQGHVAEYNLKKSKETGTMSSNTLTLNPGISDPYIHYLKDDLYFMIYRANNDGRGGIKNVATTIELKTSQSGAEIIAQVFNTKPSEVVDTDLDLGTQNQQIRMDAMLIGEEGKSNSLRVIVSKQDRWEGFSVNSISKAITDRSVCQVESHEIAAFKIPKITKISPKRLGILATLRSDNPLNFYWIDPKQATCQRIDTIGWNKRPKTILKNTYAEAPIPGFEGLLWSLVSPKTLYLIKIDENSVDLQSAVDLPGNPPDKMTASSGQAYLILIRFKDLETLIYKHTATAAPAETHIITKVFEHTYNLNYLEFSYLLLADLDTLFLWSPIDNPAINLVIFSNFFNKRCNPAEVLNNETCVDISAIDDRCNKMTALYKSCYKCKPTYSLMTYDDNQNIGFCTECADKTEFFKKGKCRKCAEVIPGCLECDGLLERCLKCLPDSKVGDKSYHLDESTGRCRECKYSEVYSWQEGKCKACDQLQGLENCFHCEILNKFTSEAKCLECQAGAFNLDKDGRCVTCQGTGQYYSLQKKECSQCSVDLSQYCVRCSEETLGQPKCLECDSQHDLSTDQSVVCGPLNCIPNCKVCDKGTLTCKECEDGYLLDNENKCGPVPKYYLKQKNAFFDKADTSALIEFEVKNFAIPGKRRRRQLTIPPRIKRGSNQKNTFGSESQEQSHDPKRILSKIEHHMNSQPIQDKRRLQTSSTPPSSSISTQISEGIIDELITQKSNLYGEATSSSSKVILPVLKAERQSSYTLKLTFDIPDNTELQNSTILIKSKNLTSPYSMEPIEVSNSYYYKGGGGGEDLMAYVGTAVNTTNDLVVIILSLISVSLALILMKLFQIIRFIIFIDVNLPRNVRRFLGVFKQDIFSYMPNALKPAASTEVGQSAGGISADECGMHWVYKSQQFKCSLFENLGSMIGQYAALLLVKALVYWLVKKLSKKQSKEESPGQKSENRDKDPISDDKNKKNQNEQGYFVKVLIKIDTILNFNFFCNYYLGGQFKALLGLFLGLKYSGWKSLAEVYELGVTILLLMANIGFGWVLVFQSLKTTIRASKENKKSLSQVEAEQQSKQDGSTEKPSKSTPTTLPESWRLFYKEIKDNLTYAKLVVLFRVLNGFALPLLLVFAISVTVTQLIILCIIFITFDVYLIANAPFKELKKNFLMIGNHAFFVLLTGLYIFMDLLKDKITEKQRYTYFGWPIIAVITLLLLMNVIVGIVSIFVETVKKFRKKKSPPKIVAKEQENEANVQKITKSEAIKPQFSTRNQNLTMRQGQPSSIRRLNQEDQNQKMDDSIFNFLKSSQEPKAPSEKEPIFSPLEKFHKKKQHRKHKNFKEKNNQNEKKSKGKEKEGGEDQKDTNMGTYFMNFKLGYLNKNPEKEARKVNGKTEELQESGCLDGGAEIDF